MTNRSELADVWAKTPSDGNACGEDLVSHTRATVAVLRSLRERHPDLARHVGEPRLWRWAELALYLHDLGKAAGPFQAYLRGHSGIWGHRHEILSLAFLPLICADEEEFKWVAAAVASHHRDAREIVYERYDPRAPVSDAALDKLTVCLPPSRAQELAVWLVSEVQVAGLTPSRSGTTEPSSFSPLPETIRRALRAYRRLVDAQAHERWQVSVALRGLVVRSDHLASGGYRGADTVRLPPPGALADRLACLRSQAKPRVPPPRGSEVFQRWLWYPYQKRLGQTDGSILVCAPTGSGKTEAALVWAYRQQARNHGGGVLMYLLPYQASINAMRKRLQSVLQCDVALLHGRALQALYLEAAADEAVRTQAHVIARRAQETARLHKPGVWVGTPYQLLRAAFRLPGYETLWVSLSGSLIVVDEIHAYEPKRLGMFIALLKNAQERWGTRVCLMTATMPTWLKALLVAELGVHQVSASKHLYERLARHRVQIVDASILDSHVLQAVSREVRAGRSVLVAVNTVKTAQAVWQALRSTSGHIRPILLHSRFAARDRMDKEAEIMRGSSASIPADRRQPALVVSTQVIEVSLDLDFDTVFTEPAPLEALVQRFGRVNRRGLRGIAPVRVLTGPADGQGIYDPRLVQGSLRVLEVADGQVLDENLVGSWLDDAYGEDLANACRRETLDSASEFEAACLSDILPFDSSPELERAFDVLFDGTEVLPKALEREYISLAADSVLKAAGLLVPVRDSMLRSARRRGALRYDEELRQTVADLPYDSELGLRLVDEDCQ